LYSVLNNLQEIINLNTDPVTKDLVTADGAGRNANQIAISRVLKSYAYYALSDIFGDVPYNSYGSDDPDFQALQQNPDNITPKYASQEKIYTDILNELKQAGDTLLKYSEERTFGVSDIIYGGDNAKWAKFANSLRLRFATRLKTKNNSLYQSHFADALEKVYSQAMRTMLFTSMPPLHPTRHLIIVLLSLQTGGILPCRNHL
jgi:hypothetical protein